MGGRDAKSPRKDKDQTVGFSVRVPYNGGLLPDIILTLCDYIGKPFRYHEEFLSLQPMFPPKSSIFPLRMDAQKV